MLLPGGYPDEKTALPDTRFIFQRAWKGFLSIEVHFQPTWKVLLHVKVQFQRAWKDVLSVEVHFQCA